MRIKLKFNFKVKKNVGSPQKRSYYWWQLSFYKELRILVDFLVGLDVGRDAGLEKCHYLQWEERKTYSDGKIQSPLLRTQDPFSPSSFSCLFLYLPHPSSSLPPPLFSSSSHHIDQDCAKQRMWPSWDTYSAGAYSRCEPDPYPTSVHILSSPAPALPLLIPHEWLFGPAHSSILFHLAVFQAVETHFAVFPLGFCHLFPVILDCYSDEEFEFLSVPLRAWCSGIRGWLTMHIG